MKINDKNIGKEFKQALESFEVQPDPVVWQNIQHLTPAQSPFLGTIAKVIYLSVVVVAIGISTFVFNTNTDEDIALVEEITSTSVIVDHAKAIPTQVVSEKEVAVSNQEQEITSTLGMDETPVPLAQEELITNVDSIKKSEIRIENIEKVKTPDVANIKKTKPAKVIEPVNTIAKTETENEVPQSAIPMEVKSTIEEFVPAFGENPIVCFGTDAYLYIEEGYDYVWNTGAYTNNIRVSPTRNQEYSVTVTNSKGQIYEHTFAVEVDNSCQAIVVPSAFSPNGDSNNDVFLALGNEHADFNMQIMNREGKILFHSTDINIGWDGTFKGYVSKMGVYICIINYKDAKGNAQFIREFITLVK